jgi:hypothetical protein
LLKIIKIWKIGLKTMFYIIKMVNVVCTYCKRELVNIYTLNKHQEKAKYCLLLRGKIQKEEFKCKYCNKILSSKQSLEIHIKKCEIVEEEENFDCGYCLKTLSSKQNLLNHENICLEKKDHELKLKDDELKVKEKDLQEKNETIIKLKLELKIENDNFKQQIEDYKDQIKELQQTIERMGTRAIDKPTTTNNNTTTNNTLNITSSIDFKDISKIKNIINDDFNLNYALCGQKGLARFVTDKFLTDNDGKLIYICTDPSRQIFKYKDSEGFIKKDVEAKKLTGFLVNSGIQEKTHDVAIDFWTDENGSIDGEKCSTLLEPAQSVKNIETVCFLKLSANARLDKHYGYNPSSNYILRSHLGLIIPNNSYVFVFICNKSPN